VIYLKNLSDSSKSHSLSTQESPVFAALVKVASTIFETSRDCRESISPPRKRRRIEKGEFCQQRPERCLSKLEKSASPCLRQNPSKQIITYEEGSIYKRYEGFLQNGNPDGEGEMTFSSGAVFKGRFEDEGRKASGTLRRKNGFVTKGVWVNWRLHGQAMIFHPDGYRIKGYFAEGVPFEGEITYLQTFCHGLYGRQLKEKQPLEKMIWSPSSVFEEASDRGLKGYSTTFSKIRAIIKEQIVIQKEPDGRTIAASPIGCRLEDYLAEGVSFQGTIIYSDASPYKRYEGSLMGAAPSGQGEMLFANGDIDKGEFAKGVLHGTGKRVLETGGWYQGKWVNGKLHGEGKCFLSNKLLLEGTFEEGEIFKGRITYLRKNGGVSKIYEGFIERELPHGKGTIVYQNGIFYEGMFKRGAFHGFGELTQTDGSSVKGEFVNGTLVFGSERAHVKEQKSILSLCDSNLF